MKKVDEFLVISSSFRPLMMKNSAFSFPSLEMFRTRDVLGRKKMNNSELET